MFGKPKNIEIEREILDLENWDWDLGNELDKIAVKIASDVLRQIEGDLSAFVRVDKGVLEVAILSDFRATFDLERLLSEDLDLGPRDLGLEAEKIRSYASLLRRVADKADAAALEAEKEYPS